MPRIATVIRKGVVNKMEECVTLKNWGTRLERLIIKAGACKYSCTTEDLLLLATAKVKSVKALPHYNI